VKLQLNQSVYGVCFRPATPTISVRTSTSRYSVLDVFCSVFFWGGGWGEILLDTALVMYSKVAVFFISRILYSMPHLLTFSIFLSSVSVIWCTLLSSFAVYVDMAPAVIGSDMISLV